MRLRFGGKVKGAEQGLLGLLRACCACHAGTTICRHIMPQPGAITGCHSRTYREPYHMTPMHLNVL